MDSEEAREYSECLKNRQLILEVKQERKKNEHQSSQSGEIRDRVKNALDIVNVIGKSISLYNDGNGEYHGATSGSSKSGALSK